jgi:hypothetical protein
MEQPQNGLGHRLAVMLLIAVAVGCVVAARLVEDAWFRGEFGAAGAAAAMVLVFFAADDLGVSPEKAIASIRLPQRNTPPSTPRRQARRQS